MTVRHKHSTTLYALSLATLISGCGSKLADASEKIDLAQAGLAVTVEAPRGGHTRKDGARAAIEWGEHGEAGFLTLGKREMELRCTPLDESCKVLEQTASTIIKETTFMKKAQLRGLANVKAGGVALGCEVTARNADDVRRLLSACQSATAPGPLADRTTLTSASSTSNAPAPPSLVAVNTAAKDAKGAFVFSIRVPADHTVLESGASRTFGAPKGTPAPDQLSATVSPYLAVTSLATAEKETRGFDVAGLETITERRELTKKSFLLATAPRGTGRLMTIFVYATGKTRGAVARCSGSEKLRATLEEMCTSLEVE